MLIRFMLANVALCVQPVCRHILAYCSFGCCLPLDSRFCEFDRAFYVQLFSYFPSMAFYGVDIQIEFAGDLAFLYPLPIRLKISSSRSLRVCRSAPCHACSNCRRYVSSRYYLRSRC
jgi:hypothetical protein